MEKNQTVFCERCLKQPLRTGKKRTDFPGAKAPGKSVFDAGRGLLDSNGLNLAQGALGQILHRHAGAGGLGGEVLGVHLVEGGEVGDIGQEAGGLDHLVEAGTGGLRMAPTFLQLHSAWAAMPSGMVPSAGFTGSWPEVMTRPLVS